jgi:hypothetical protein
MRTTRWLSLMIVAGLAGPAVIGRAQAQSPVQAQAPVERLHGTVTSMAGDMLSLHTEDGDTLAISVPPTLRIGAVTNRRLSDIKPGEFVGSAAVRGRDGKLHAQEVHIFPEALRGTGEGHRPMDQPEQSMTNATVDGVADAPTGRTLHLRYAGGEQTIEVGPDVRVVGLIPGDRALLVPGAAVTVRASRAADGTLTAVSLQAEKNGVKPLP